MKVAALRQKMRVVAQRLRSAQCQAVAYWQGLTRRERQQVLLMSALLSVALLWLLFMRPALHTLSHWQQELPRLRSQNVALQAVLAEVAGGQINPRAGNTAPEQRLTQSLAAAGLAEGHQLQAQGTGWELSFAQPVDAQTLVNWLLNTPAALGMTVQQANLERVSPARNGSARVVASVTLAVQQQRKGE